MISRRILLAGSLGAFIFGTAAEAIGRKPKAKPEPVIGGPHTLARQEWPPAITPEYVGIVDRGYACFADDMGRLAVVDLKREDNPAVIGELFGIGRKVVAVSITQHRAIAVVQVESGADTVFQLVIASLTPANDISIMSRTVLANFSEPSCVASFGDLIVVGGAGLNRENQLVVYTIGKKKAVEPLQLGALTLERSPFKLDLQDKTLLALCGQESTELAIVAIANPRNPELMSSLRLDGSYNAVSRNREQIMVAGYGSDRNCQAKLITLRPGPAVAASVILPAVTEILDMAAQKGQFLLLVNQGSRQAVMPVIVGKKNALAAGSTVLLPGGGRGASPRAHIAVKERDAYVASDWGGVQVLNVSKAGWQFSYSHTIPRLPASALVAESGLVVIACAELKLYNLADIRHPVLVESSDLSSTVRSMQSLGRTFLCLSRDLLTLRSMNKPGEVVSSCKAKGSSFALNRSTGLAYVFDKSEKGCTANVFRVREDSVKAVSSFELAVPVRKAIAQSGRLLTAGLNELNLFKLETESEISALAARKFPNLAIRDMVMPGGDLIFISCVDENLRGSVLAISAAKEDLPVLGACEVPVDASALAVSGNKAVVLGRGKNGKDQVAYVSVGDPVRMKVTESFDTIEAASAVSIQNNTAIIAGRGIEILDLG